MATPIPENRARFTLGEVAKLTQGQLLGPPELALEGVTTDSRSARGGALFVALRGERFDGHAFCEKAVESGAAALLVEEGAQLGELGAHPRVLVADTLAALGALAQGLRRRAEAELIAVTGSVGKTTTKELIAAGLAAIEEGPILKSEGNLNNRVGLPMSLLALGEARRGVLEMGMSEPGEIAALRAIAEPKVALITAIAAVHLEGVGDLRSVAREKGAILAELPAGGVAVIPDGEPLLDEVVAAAAPPRVLSFGSAASDAGGGADVGVLSSALVEEAPGELRTRVALRLPGREEPLALRLRLLGEGAAQASAAAFAALHALYGEGLDGAALERAARGMEALPPIDGRMVPRPGPRGSLLLDDTYNASPRAVSLALKSAAELAALRGARLIVVLGDMLELGHESARLHAALGREVIERGAACFIACGEAMNAAGRAALSLAYDGKRSGPRTRIVFVKDPKVAGECVAEALGEGDVILFKASRGVRLEGAIEALLAQPEGALGGEEEE